jgi:hypothetical protein
VRYWEDTLRRLDEVVVTCLLYAGRPSRPVAMSEIENVRKI